MKTRILLFFTAFVLSSSCYSQENPFAKFEFQTQNSSEIDMQRTGVIAGFSFLKNEKSRFLNSVSYTNTILKNNYETNFFNGSDNFNSVDYKLEYTYKLNQNILFTAKINPSANFESDFKISKISLFGGFEISKQINSKSKIEIGVNRNSIFRKPMVLPSLTYSYAFKNNVKTEIGFPCSKILYSNNDRNIFSIENNFNGYFLNTDTSDRISFSQMTTSFQFDRKFDDNFMITLKGGYDFNRKLILNDSSDHLKKDLNIADGANLKIGIKYQL